MERPILFSTPMVQAILQGKKTMTRRIIKPQPPQKLQFPYGFVTGSSDKNDIGKFCWTVGDICDGRTHLVRPRYQKDDTIWVRETWAKVEDFKNYAELELDKDLEFFYKCDDFGKEHVFVDVGVQRWRPSIFMPREACRIKLKITDIRVERLQEITEEDAKAEGYPGGHSSAKSWFRDLWDKINAKRGFDWYSNEWVWVVTFERMTDI